LVLRGVPKKKKKTQKIYGPPKKFATNKKKNLPQTTLIFGLDYFFYFAELKKK
jgi:hypothetical protein